MVGLLALMPLAAVAQQPAPSAPANPAPVNPAWDTDTRVDRQAPTPGKPQPTPTLRPVAPPGNPTNHSVVPRSPAVPTAEVRLEAFLTDDGQRIGQGLVWHAFEEAPASADTANRPKPRHVGSWREATPTVRLAAGTYHITATFGRAHLTRKLTMRPGAAAATERFVLNAGGLRIAAVLANGDPLPEMSFGYDILSDDTGRAEGRTKVLSGVKPGLIIRLNAGIYQIVSTFGDANSVVRADVTVEAGKLTEATIAHHAARVTFKLVNTPGGDALAETRWTILTAQGDKIRDSDGALPSHILAAGAYEVVARNGERTFKRSFIVAAGEPVQIEVVIPSAGR